MMTSLVVEHHKRGIISAFLLCVTHAYFSYDAFGLQKDPVQAVEIELREVADALKKVEMEIEAVSIDLKKLEKKISEVEVEIQDAKKAGDKEELTYLRDEKKQLRDDKKQLRAEKNRLLDKEKQLRDKENKLRDQQQVAPGRYVGLQLVVSWIMWLIKSFVELKKRCW
jgi:DNA repair exonuclease SbcCD ATPase subunit